MKHLGGFDPMSNAQQPVWPAAYISAMEHNDIIAGWKAKWELAETILTQIRRDVDLPVNTEMVQFIRELKQERDTLKTQVRDLMLRAGFYSAAGKEQK